MAGFRFMLLPLELQEMIIRFAVEQDDGIPLLPCFGNSPYHPAICNIASIRSTSHEFYAVATPWFFSHNTFIAPAMRCLRSFILNQGPNLPNIRHLNISQWHFVSRAGLRDPVKTLVELLSAFTQLQTLTLVTPWGWESPQFPRMADLCRQFVPSIQRVTYTRANARYLLSNIVSSNYQTGIPTDEKEAFRACAMEVHRLQRPRNIFFPVNTLNILVEDYERFEQYFADGESDHLVQPAPELQYLWRWIRADKGLNWPDRVRIKSKSYWN